MHDAEPSRTTSNTADKNDSKSGKKPLDGYKFMLYTTESCPRNQTEWSERSSAINCTEGNGYLCLPNEDLTELLEFCYFDHRILIAKGLCMFLRKRDSYIDDYSCRNFVEGCPNSTYRINEAYKYRSCVSIGNGCFLDDPTCVRTTATYKVTFSSRTTAAVVSQEKTKHERNDWVWIITLLGVIVLVFIPIVMYRIKIRASINEHYIVVDRSQTNSFYVDVNECDEKGFNPLYHACFNGHESTVKFLIDNGADVNLCTKEGTSPFLVACQNGHDSIVRLLLNNSADVNLCTKNRTSPFLIACQNGHDSIVRLLLNNGADVNLCTKDGYTPFSAACRNGHTSIAKLLLNKDINVNVCDEVGLNPLYNACFHGHESTVKFLIDKGADVNLCTKEGTSPVFVACQNGHDSIVRLLLNNGADVNLCTKNRTSPFLIACQNGHDSIVRLLLNNGADVNLCTKDGYTPFSAACRNGHTSIAKLLINKRH
ncbi:ankyrin-1-like [Crassostrea angulata]|uniref:ankyrin-1-like n=1 Tax=Magallana angulata TaxID=2784310 RepID=UPI0022B11847|nr:ankyrin-1-like [Crassostrea angulata]